MYPGPSPAMLPNCLFETFSSKIGTNIITNNNKMYILIKKILIFLIKKCKVLFDLKFNNNFYCHVTYIMKYLKVESLCSIFQNFITF